MIGKTVTYHFVDSISGEIGREVLVINENEAVYTE
jgi:hypothetical protein